MEQRLQKFLAHAGVASRRKCEEMILEGRVKVNGKIIKELGTKVDPSKDKVLVDGKAVKQFEKKIYLKVNKPRGYVSTVEDDKGRKTVLDLLENITERVYPVGRLDYDSEGLLLLTNDGELTYALTHPKHEIGKTYRARVKGIPSVEKLEQLANGIELEDGITAPAKVFLTHVLNGNALLEITIHEGRNRQVRRMCEKIGHPVIRLVRTRIGPLELRNLGSGEVKKLTPRELSDIKKAAGLATRPGAKKVAKGKPKPPRK
ncbi:pseudouridine synthase [Peptococcaceae bacterium 1198_IL3148]